MLTYWYTIGSAVQLLIIVLMFSRNVITLQFLSVNQKYQNLDIGQIHACKLPEVRRSQRNKKISLQSYNRGINELFVSSNTKRAKCWFSKLSGYDTYSGRYARGNVQYISSVNIGERQFGKIITFWNFHRKEFNV